MTAKVSNQPFVIYHQEASHGGARKDRVDAVSLWGKGKMTSDVDIANQLLIAYEGMKIADGGYKPFLSRWEVAVKVGNTSDKVQYVIVNKKSLINRLKMNEDELEKRIEKDQVAEYIGDCLQDLTTNEKEINEILKKGVEQGADKITQDDGNKLVEFLQMDINSSDINLSVQNYQQKFLEQAIKKVWWNLPPLANDLEWPVLQEKVAVRLLQNIYLRKPSGHQEPKWNFFPWDKSGRYDLRIVHDFAYTEKPQVGKNEARIWHKDFWYIVNKEDLERIGLGEDSDNDIRDRMAPLQDFNLKMNAVNSQWLGEEEDIENVQKACQGFLGGKLSNDREVLNDINKFLAIEDPTKDQVLDLAFQLEKLGVIAPEDKPEEPTITPRQAFRFYNSEGKRQDRFNILDLNNEIDIADSGGQFWIARDKKEITNNPAYCGWSHQIAIKVGDRTREGYHYEILNLNSLMKRLEIDENNKKLYAAVQNEFKQAESEGRAHEVVDKYLKLIEEKRNYINEALRLMSQDTFMPNNLNQELWNEAEEEDNDALVKRITYKSILNDYFAACFPDIHKKFNEIGGMTQEGFLGSVTSKLPWIVPKDGLGENESAKITDPDIIQFPDPGRKQDWDEKGRYAIAPVSDFYYRERPDNLPEEQIEVYDEFGWLIYNKSDLERLGFDVNSAPIANNDIDFSIILAERLEQIRLQYEKMSEWLSTENYTNPPEDVHFNDAYHYGIFYLKYMNSLNEDFKDPAVQKLMLEFIEKNKQITKDYTDYLVFQPSRESINQRRIDAIVELKNKLSELGAIKEIQKEKGEVRFGSREYRREQSLML